MRWLINIAFPLILLMGCSPVNCPLNGVVMTNYKLDGDVTTLNDALTVSTKTKDGRDTILLNKLSSAESFKLPVSYSSEKDELYFSFQPTGKEPVVDTVTVYKENMAHFESIECPPAFFHRITNVQTTHHQIDSIVIKNENVNYDALQPHFHLYLKMPLY